MLLGESWIEFIVWGLGQLVDGFFAAAAAVGADEDAHVEQIVDGVAEGAGRISRETPANILKGAEVETGEVVPEDVVEIGEAGWRVHEPFLWGRRLLRRLRLRGRIRRLFEMLEEDTGLGLVLGEVDGGVEGGRWSVAGFEGREGEGELAGRRVKMEHEVHGGGNGGRTAKEAVLVGVVGYQDGGVAGFGKAAEVEENGQDGGLAGLVAAAQQADKVINDDELGVVVKGAVYKGIGGLVVAEVEARQGGEMEREACRDGVGEQRGVQAGEELVRASLLVNEEDGAGLSSAGEPRLASGDANGEIYGGEGLLGARVTDEHEEAGTVKEAVDGPGVGGRRLQGVGSREQDAGCGWVVGFGHVLAPSAHF